MNAGTLLLDFGLVLGAAMAGGLLAKLLRQPVLLGYLIAGMIIGPNTPGFVGNVDIVHHIADWGVTLLMFTMGVHFDLRALWPVRRIAVFGALLQVALTIALGFALGVALGWGAYRSLYLGCILALSSTLVAMRELDQRGHSNTSHGRLTLGILIVQDLLTVILVGVLPSLGGTGGEPLASTAYRILLSVVLLGAVVLILALVYPHLLALIVRARSEELLVLAAVSVCFVVAFASRMLGFSIELGAFIAGLVISETEHRHRVLAEVMPLRHLFGSVFFVSIGMIVRPEYLTKAWPVVLGVVALVLIGKTLVTVLAVRGLGASWNTARVAGFGLAQIGEFSFVLAGVGVSAGALPPEMRDLTTAVAVATIAATPYWLSLGARLPREPAIIYQQG